MFATTVLKLIISLHKRINLKCGRKGIDYLEIEL